MDSVQGNENRALLSQREQTHPCRERPGSDAYLHQGVGALKNSYRPRLIAYTISPIVVSFS